MKFLAPLTFALILLIAACGTSNSDTMHVQTPESAVSMSSVYNYRCDSGQTIAATYYASADAVTVHYKGKSYHLRVAISGSGARYVGGAFEWWTKGSGPGSEGSFYRHTADGTSGVRIERCTAF